MRVPWPTQKWKCDHCLRCITPLIAADCQIRVSRIVHRCRKCGTKLPVRQMDWNAPSLWCVIFILHTILIILYFSYANETAVEVSPLTTKGQNIGRWRSLTDKNLESCEWLRENSSLWFRFQKNHNISRVTVISPISRKGEGSFAYLNY